MCLLYNLQLLHLSKYKCKFVFTLQSTDYIYLSINVSIYSTIYRLHLSTLQCKYVFTLHSTATTGCPNKHGNSVTNSISSLLWISIVNPNFKSHINMSARVYFMKTVCGCKDVSIMSPQDVQRRRKSLLCLYAVNFLVLLSTPVFTV